MKPVRSHPFLKLHFLFCLLFALSGCGSRTPLMVETTGTVQPAPTVAAIFSQQPTVPPVLAPQLRPSTSPLPLRSTPQSANTVPTEREVVVYDDALSAGWGMQQSKDMTYDAQSRDFVAKGLYALKATTSKSTATLYFTLQPGAPMAFRRSEVLGLRFKLSGGAGPVPNDALAVTIVGSNRQPFWVANDASVTSDTPVTAENPLFSETRLYYLKINNTIPPRTWTDVEVWLDDLIYDPEYEYVTGFYLKTDRQDSFYVDDIVLVMAS